MGLFFSKKKRNTRNNESDEEESNRTPLVPRTEKPKTPQARNPMVVAMYDFIPRSSNELGFRKGENLEILSRHGEDWWRGRHMTTKQEGYVPVPYLASRESLDSQDWYFGDIDRESAEALLRNHENTTGSFLVRSAGRDTHNHKYSLSARVVQGSRAEVIKHYRILTNCDGYFFISRNEIFMTLNDLVDGYMSVANTKGIGKEISQPCKRKVPVLSYLTPDERWEIPVETIAYDRKIGEGSFGEVWLGVWNHQVPVAIKSIADGKMSQDEFLREAAIMKRFKHENILTLYGVCTHQYPTLIITEFMPNGALIDFLRNEEDLEMCYKIHIAKQVANGMSYLEKKRLVHRDLAARNVLVGDTMNCKIADFGLARIIHGDVYCMSSGVSLPVKWTAPEAYIGNIFTIKSDVWSFAILCYEIFTNGGIPYPGFTKREVMEEVSEGYRLPKPPQCPDQAYELMLFCWKMEADDRPAFCYIFEFFRNFNIYEERSYDEQAFGYPPSGF